MWWLFGFFAAIVTAVTIHWIVRRRETIRRYRDHLQAAADESEPPS